MVAAAIMARLLRNADYSVTPWNPRQRNASEILVSRGSRGPCRGIAAARLTSINPRLHAHRAPTCTLDTGYFGHCLAPRHSSFTRPAVLLRLRTAADGS